MRRRKFLLGSMALFASGGFLTGAGAFSSTTVERGVRIEVVGDEDAYLGLSDGQTEEEGVLFGVDMPRTAPEKFNVRNQTATAVDIDIELTEENLKFTGWDADNKVDHVSVEGNTLIIEGMEAGTKVSDVGLDIPGTSESPVSDTLRFEVAGEDDGLHIEAERDLRLEPDEIQAEIDFANISATFEITNLDSVDHGTVKVNGLDTEHKGKNKYQIENPSSVSCSPSETITVTVTGKTNDGVSFEGVASGVNCSQQQDGSGENQERGADSNGNKNDNGESDDGNGSNDSSDDAGSSDNSNGDRENSGNGK